MSETFFTLETVNDWDDKAEPVDGPLLEDPAVGELAPLDEEPVFDAELLLPDDGLLELSGEALEEADDAPD